MIPTIKQKVDKLADSLLAMDSDSGEGKLLKEFIRHYQDLRGVLSKIEDITNLDGDTDWDYESRIDTVNSLAHRELYRKPENEPKDDCPHETE